MKRTLLFVIVGVLVVAVLYGLKEYFRTNKDLAGEKPVASLKAPELIKAFDTDSAGSNRRYVNQVIAVSGIVTAVQDKENPVVVTLGETGTLSSVQCSMDSTHAADLSGIKIGKTLSVKGLCTGALQEEIFGTDVVLNRCVVLDGEAH